MKIHYIGTGAADWLPEEKKEGIYFRDFSAVCVNDELMIDMAFTTDISKLPVIKEIIYTHSHNDHFDLKNLIELSKKNRITVYCEEHFAKTIEGHEEFDLVPLTPEVEITTKLGYKLIPLPANHLTGIKGEVALGYIISKGDDKIFFGTDGAMLTPKEYYRICREKPFNRMIFDGTLGYVEQDSRIFTHNSLPMVYLMVDALKEMNVLKENGQNWITHISRFSNLEASELHLDLAKHQMYVPDDGTIDQF